MKVDQIQVPVEVLEAEVMVAVLMDTIILKEVVAIKGTEDNKGDQVVKIEMEDITMMTKQKTDKILVNENMKCFYMEKLILIDLF